MCKYLLGAVLFAGLFFASCSTQEQAPIVSNKLETKHVPSDEFFLQRSYPDGQFSIKAYINGLSDARQMAVSRTTTAGGFDQE